MTNNRKKGIRIAGALFIIYFAPWDIGPTAV